MSRALGLVLAASALAGTGAIVTAAPAQKAAARDWTKIGGDDTGGRLSDRQPGRSGEAGRIWLADL